MLYNVTQHVYAYNPNPTPQVRYTNAEWCEAALSGPGGQLYAPSSSSSSTAANERERESERPLGVWCALPEKGKFV
jgi:hypothetical protein